MDWLWSGTKGYLTDDMLVAADGKALLLADASKPEDYCAQVSATFER